MVTSSFWLWAAQRSFYLKHVRVSTVRRATVFLKPPLRTHRGPIQRRAFVSDHLSNTFAHPCIKIGVHPGTFSVRAGRQVALGQHTTPPGLAEGASAPPLPLRL